MTQLGEAIAMGVIAESSFECPLDHSDLKPIQSENEFVGDGGTLGNNMEAGKSTITYAPNQRSKPDKRPYPVTDDGSSWPVEVDGRQYPVTGAAHHLIPAQAALKKAVHLHEWMVYKKNPQPLGGSGGKKNAEGIVWADIGYDVNGVENGVWLPGNYAVGGGVGGTGDWTSAASALDNEGASAKPVPPAPPGSTQLTGLRHTFADDNRKGQYVLGATYVFNAQFHDAHPDYSLLVTGILDKIGEQYKKRPADVQPPCPKCEERRKQVKDEGQPTHFQLAHRLNSVSDRLSRYLIGKRGHPEVYTSQWGRGAHLERMFMVSSNSPIPLE